eukprot:1143305-Pelagomonas_calceolata.AAC.10
MVRQIQIQVHFHNNSPCTAQFVPKTDFLQRLSKNCRTLVLSPGVGSPKAYISTLGPFSARKKKGGHKEGYVKNSLFTMGGELKPGRLADRLVANLSQPGMNP